MGKQIKEQNIQNNKADLYDRKTRKAKIVIVLASIVEILMLVLELYFMIRLDGAIVLIVTVAVCMAIVLFALVAEILELSQQKKNRDRAEFEDLYKAQKASYIALKKYFEEIDDRLRVIEESNDFSDEIINAQKAVAKVTINRNKENTDALMNSNDMLIQHIFDFEQKLQDSGEELLRQNAVMLEETKNALMQQAMSSADGNSKDNVWQKIVELEDRLDEIQHRDIRVNQGYIDDPESIDGLADSIKDISLHTEAVKDSEKDILDSENIIKDSVDDIVNNEEYDVDRLVQDIKVVEEYISNEENNMNDDVSTADGIEEDSLKAEDEEVINLSDDSISAMPELSDDPNHVMTPEEIAALFANM